MGKVLFMKKGEVHKAPSKYPENFADATWAEVIEACQNIAVPETWDVGDQLNMTINGTSYAIDIIGKNHDTYADGSGKAPLTFQMHDCYATTYAMNSSNTNAGGWADCAMRNTHLPALLALLPTEVQNGIREVNKSTSIGSASSTTGTTADKLFLLSEVEIFGPNYSSSLFAKGDEGSQYEYYAAGNSRIKNVSGNAAYWWERSPYGGNSTNFCRVWTDGNTNYGYATYSFGISFAFCF